METNVSRERLKRIGHRLYLTYFAALVIGAIATLVISILEYRRHEENTDKIRVYADSLEKESHWVDDPPDAAISKMSDEELEVIASGKIKSQPRNENKNRKVGPWVKYQKVENSAFNPDEYLEQYKRDSQRLANCIKNEISLGNSFSLYSCNPTDSQQNDIEKLLKINRWTTIGGTSGDFRGIVFMLSWILVTLVVRQWLHWLLHGTLLSKFP